MLKFSVNDLISDDENCYSFVIAIAKRARRIADQANDESEILDEKPVQMAVREFAEGKFHIMAHTIGDVHPEVSIPA
ncbi:MAG: DNA-directed RNA polymerase subunit omega [Clostridia bacterium]|nr:DNA-directed RNA polymerase subunit omega [Clostridia bacterium]